MRPSQPHTGEYTSMQAVGRVAQAPIVPQTSPAQYASPAQSELERHEVAAQAPRALVGRSGRHER